MTQPAPAQPSAPLAETEIGVRYEPHAGADTPWEFYLAPRPTYALARVLKQINRGPTQIGLKALGDTVDIVARYPDLTPDPLSACVIFTGLTLADAGFAKDELKRRGWTPAAELEGL